MGNLEVLIANPCLLTDIFNCIQKQAGLTPITESHQIKVMTKNVWNSCEANVFFSKYIYFAHTVCSV